MSNDWQPTTVQGSRLGNARAAGQTDGARRMPVQERAASEAQQSERPQAAKSTGKSAKRRKKKRNPWLRMLRLLVVPMLLFWAVVAGLYVGYSVLGHQPKGEVFEVQTWKHMFDLMFSNE